MAEKERSVGLLVMTFIPDQGWVAVLQIRGFFNTQNMKKESYSGACQVTVHGKIKNGENVAAALEREMIEEMGYTFFRILKCAIDNGTLNYEECMLLDTETKEVTTYVVYLYDSSILRFIRWGPDSGGMQLVTQDRIYDIHILIDLDKEEGVTNRHDIMMFPDEREAVIRAFNRLRPEPVRVTCH